MNSKRVLITGVAGFIGSRVARSLLDDGFEVIGVDSFSDFYSEDYKRYRLNFFGIKNLVHQVDVACKEEIERQFEVFRPQIVVHLAAQGGVRASKVNPKPYITSNQMGFLNVLELSERYLLEKFIYASSSSVYGDNLHPPYREDDPLPAPKSVYAASKLSNELVARDFPTRGIQRIGLRLFTVYGPLGRPDMAMFRLLASSVLGRKFELTANLSVKRDFTYIDDVADVVGRICRSSSSNLPKILNVAGSKPYSLQELLNIMEAHGINTEILACPEDPLDVKVTHGSTEVLSQHNLGVPQTKLIEGVRKTWEWMLGIDQGQIQEWYESSY